MIGIAALLVTTAATTQPYYVGAVVHGSFMNVSTSSAEAEPFIQSAVKQRAQIVVFSEGGLGSNTAPSRRAFCEPLPPVGQVLCRNSSSTPLAAAMSCLAHKYGVYIVMALCDVQPCEASAGVDCARWAVNGWFHFNAQIALAPTGRLVAKYHKMHLYDPSPGVGESTHASYPPTADPMHFTTDFGVTFGMHTCFDMAFRTPAAALALDVGISDFVFPTGWVVKAPPMMPPLEMQQGWSRGVGVNLLAADGGHAWGSSGSGIYSRGTVLASTYDVAEPSSYRKLLVAQLPILTRPLPNVVASDSDWKHYKTSPPAAAFASSTTHRATDEPITGAMSRFMPSRHRSGTVRAASGALRCELNYTAGVHRDPRPYALVARDGHWLRGVVPTRSCLLFRCQSATNCSVDPLYGSVADLNGTTQFDALELGGTFRAGDLVLPLLATDSGRVLDESALLYRSNRMRLRTAGGVPVLNAMLFAATNDAAASTSEVDVEQYGAAADNLTLCTSAINAAITAVSARGGGVVHARAPGSYLTGRIEMQSHVALKIGPRSTLQSSGDVEHWTPRLAIAPPACGGSFVENRTLGGILFAAGARNFSISGGGTVDGGGLAFNHNHNHSHMLVFYSASDAIVEDLTLRHASTWTLNPKFSQRLTFRRLSIVSDVTGGANFRNTDGFDPMACRDVSFVDSYYRGGDDCVAIKSGVEPGEHDVPIGSHACGVPSENILVNNITCAASHGLTIGSEVAGGVRNVTISNVRITDSIAAVRIKSVCGRGAYVHDILYENISAVNVTHAVWINQRYQPSPGPPPPAICSAAGTTDFARITVRHLRAENVSGDAFELVGLKVEGSAAGQPPPLHDVVLEDVHIRGAVSSGVCTNAQVRAVDVSPNLPKGPGCKVTSLREAMARPAAYLALNSTVIPVLPSPSAPCSPLPKYSLVVPPGVYCFGGEAFELRAQGLHRLYLLGAAGGAEQRIVLQTDTPDVHALLSAIAWLRVHGDADDRKWQDERPYLQMEQLALHRKLSLTCGNVSALASAMLARHAGTAVTSRVVGIAALRHAGPAAYGYPPPPIEAHALLEVYFKATRKWALYDLDLNSHPVSASTGEPLSLLELACAVAIERAGGARQTLSATGIVAHPTHAVRLVPLSGGTRLDTSHPNGGSDMLGATQFEEELVRADPLRWYNAMLDGLYVHYPPKPAPVQRTISTCCGCGGAEIAMLRSLPTFVFLNTSEYKRQMYSTDTDAEMVRVFPNGFDAPSLLLIPGTQQMLAVAQGPRSDPNHGQLEVRVSSDGGASWSRVPSPFPTASHGQCCAQLVWDGSKVILFYGEEHADKKGCDRWTDPHGSFGWAILGVMQTFSLDGGRSWSAPLNISAAFMPNRTSCIAPTSGNGVRTRSGRLIWTAVHNSYKGDVVIYSDNAGKTYQSSWGLHEPGLDEGQVAQLPNGSLILVMRNCWHATGCREATTNLGGAGRRMAYSISNDGGVTWGPVRLHPDLVSPVCKASILGYKGATLFAGPYNSASIQRFNLTILASDDNAATFPRSLQLYAGPAGYTSLQCGLGGRTDCAVLFDRMDGIFLMRFSASDVQ